MAKSRRWSRYEPPERRRTESGRLEVDPLPKVEMVDRAERTTGPRKSHPKQDRKPGNAKSGQAAGRGSSGRNVTIGVLGALVVVVVVLVVVGVTGGGGDDDSSDGVDRETLSETFIAEGLELAQAEAPDGSEPVAVDLTTYQMSVEFFDPNRRLTKHLELSKYDAGTGSYSVRVTESYYDDYQPPPIDLAAVEPAALVAAAEEAIGGTDDVTTWSVRVETNYDTGVLEATAQAYGDDAVEVVQRLD